jgi:predicted Zn-ribbon and HTH transcriptional regulator
VTFRKDLLAQLTVQPRSVSAIARELGLSRGDVEEELRHIIRTAKAAAYHVVIRPAQCRACGFIFGPEKLRKPGKCPACRSTRVYEAQLQIEPPTTHE